MGLIMTRARILRLFAIASRSSVLRAKLFGNTMPGVGTGGSAGEDAAGAGATGCLGCSTLAGDSAFLLQATTRKAVKSNKGTRNRRDEFEGSGIHPPLARLRLSICFRCRKLTASQSIVMRYLFNSRS